MSKVMIAMSGGVDSAAAAWLMMREGHICQGATMRLWDTGGECGGNQNEENNSGGQDGDPTAAAESVARRLGIPFHVMDAKAYFADRVVRYFADSYFAGATPNPCVACNQMVKFGYLWDQSQALGCDAMATGHYARIVRQNGRYLLQKAVDPAKDQSYVLYTLTQEQLSRSYFPLGETTKQQVREIARQEGFVNAEQKESQDICFIPDGDYANFIRRFTGKTPEKGQFVDTEGRDLGEHKGIIHYTVGQRRGLGIAAATPLYVCRVCPDSNRVVLGTSHQLFSKEVTARQVNLIAADKLEGKVRVKAKLRYRHQEQPATAWQDDDGLLHISFDEAQRAVTKGQSVVLYDGEFVLGGGIIC